MALPNTSVQKQAIQTARQVLEKKPVFLDTETTGLDRNAEIVEICIINTDDTILFHSLVRPSAAIPPDAIAIHGITNEMVQKAPTWPAIWPIVRSVLAGRLIAIYNEEYDLRLMQQSHARYRLPWRENFSTFCIMKLYARYYGQWDPARRAYRYLSLEEASRRSQIPVPNTHRALDDTRLTRALLLHIANQAT